ncbi:Hsp20/alpha crystallin family protein [Flammeovirga sp. OC4]|uniref:Hsp20/alpha crystallin family protein n=1 Tax=Flammeovirga sp. OC4 TaxID=1382345 RepID=UPI0006940B15|nr:Hsp20/alpha crystallin family protein [Flammeovirga sp. OC4]
MSITTYRPSARRSFVSNVINAVEKSRQSFVPVNIKEDEAAFYLELVVPGYKKEFFSIDVENNRLNINYKQPKEENKVEEKFLVNAYQVSDFEKAFRITDLIKVEVLEAKFDAGILTVTLPKSEEKKPVKIEVR